jgi:hypothetical protein
VESRKQLIEKYALKDEKANLKLNAENTQYEFEPEQRVEFEKEFAELSKEKIEIDVYKFTLDQFGDLKIPGVVMSVLERFIEEGE